MVTKPETSTKGFALSVHRTVLRDMKGTAACNVLVPTAIFKTGNSYSSFTELCDVMNLQALSTRHCYSMQRRYIIPEVEEMWRRYYSYGNSYFLFHGVVWCHEPTGTVNSPLLLHAKAIHHSGGWRNVETAQHWIHHSAISWLSAGKA